MNTKALRNENSLDLLVLLDQAKRTLKNTDQKSENSKLKTRIFSSSSAFFINTKKELKIKIHNLSQSPSNVHSEQHALELTQL